jgi:mannose-6-phosphate isomerase
LDDEIQRATERLFDWLANSALPLWSTTGVDRRNGGFVEQLGPDGEVIADVRRARLVARQIFSFKSAAALGWDGPADELIDHGVDALLNNHLSSAFVVLPRFHPSNNEREGDFDLYDQAFVLFALAHAYGHQKDPKLEHIAISILEKMREGWAHSAGGFADERPARSPLKANPHMHLLEASLAWVDVTSRPEWSALADEISALCLQHFVQPETGALHEYFDCEWNVLRGPDDVVEPGHQAEWAWLLLRWNRQTRSSQVEPTARRLMEVAETHGIDLKQQRLVNELNADLSLRDRRLRLWPQTERIKALAVFRENSRDEQQRAQFSRDLVCAIHALLGYFDHPIKGSWWEHFDADGRPLREPARASSLYHIVGAANELSRVTGLRFA